MIEQGEQLGRLFERVVLYEDTYMRGRKEGEIFELFRQCQHLLHVLAAVEPLRGQSTIAIGGPLSGKSHEHGPQFDIVSACLGGAIETRMKDQ